MKPETVTIAIVDDHQIVIDGLKSLLQGHPVFKVAIETTDPLLMTGLLENTAVDILLTDVMMPGMNGAELAKAVHRQFPQIKILALSMSGQGDLVNQMIDESDIAGYILKNIGKQELLKALEKISAGGIYFSDEVLNEMMKSSDRKKTSEEAHLTLREIEIIRLIEQEYSNKKIADSLTLYAQ